MQAGKGGSGFSDRHQEIGDAFGFLQTSAIAVIAPAERDDAPPAKKAVKFECGGYQPLAGSDESLFFGAIDEFEARPEALRKTRWIFEQLNLACRHPDL